MAGHIDEFVFFFASNLCMLVRDRDTKAVQSRAIVFWIVFGVRITVWALIHFSFHVGDLMQGTRKIHYIFFLFASWEKQKDVESSFIISFLNLFFFCFFSPFKQQKHYEYMMSQFDCLQQKVLTSIFSNNKKKTVMEIEMVETMAFICTPNIHLNDFIRW